MTKDEALKMALEALEIGLPLIEDFGSKEQLNTQHKAIAAIYEVYEKAKQNSVIGVQYVQGIPFFPPPQRTWVGLTDKEIEAIWKIAMFADYGIGAELSNQPFVHYARAIEAKLKERTHEQVKVE